MTERQQLATTPSPTSPVAGTVERGSAPREVDSVVGPTLCDREPAFRRGIASEDRAPTWNNRSSHTPTPPGPSRFYSRVAVVAILLLSATVFAGCGVPFIGGDDAAESTDTTTSTTSTPATGTPGATGTPATGGTPAPAATTAEADPDLAAACKQVNSVVGKKVETSDLTPKSFLKPLGRDVVVVLVYQPQAVFSEVARRQVKAAVKGRKNVTLLEFRAGQFTEYGDLLERLCLFEPPSVAVIARNEVLSSVYRGYADSALVGFSVAVAGLMRPTKAPVPKPKPAKTTKPASSFDSLATGKTPTTASTTTTTATTATTTATTTTPPASATTPPPVAAP